jgi:hypothetical protein
MAEIETDVSPAAVAAMLSYLRGVCGMGEEADFIQGLAAERDRLHAGLSSIVHFQSPLTRSQVREAANELLNNKPDYQGGDQSPLAAMLSAASAEIARLRQQIAWFQAEAAKPPFRVEADFSPPPQEPAK